MKCIISITLIAAIIIMNSKLLSNPDLEMFVDEIATTIKPTKVESSKSSVNYPKNYHLSRNPECYYVTQESMNKVQNLGV